MDATLSDWRAGVPTARATAVAAETARAAPTTQPVTTASGRRRGNGECFVSHRIARDNLAGSARATTTAQSWPLNRGRSIVGGLDRPATGLQHQQVGSAGDGDDLQASQTTANGRVPPSEVGRPWSSPGLDGDPWPTGDGYSGWLSRQQTTATHPYGLTVMIGNLRQRRDSMNQRWRGVGDPSWPDRHLGYPRADGASPGSPDAPAMGAPDGTIGLARITPGHEVDSLPRPPTPADDRAEHPLRTQ